MYSPKVTAHEQSQVPNLGNLRQVIPPHCFKPSTFTSATYIIRDIVSIFSLAYLGLQIQHIPLSSGRIIAWLGYGLLQGYLCTGLWILGHECGHGALFESEMVSNICGWFLHSALLVPYFSWKITHARHHRYTGHMEKDMVFVPYTREEYASRLKTTVDELYHLAEDTPLVNFGKILRHQLLGWPLYLLFNVTGGKKSGTKGGEKPSVLRQSHFDPSSFLFSRSQFILILLSDLGLAFTLAGLWAAKMAVGWSTILLLYGMPWLWVHHWLVAITYLQHTHPDVPHYTANSWTFTKGALCTVDRNFGLVDKHLFHGIIGTHVVHHLFPSIPFYKAEEATRAIVPLLGDHYRAEPTDSFLLSLWTTFRKCKWVTDASMDGQNGAHGTMRWYLKTG